MADIMDLLSLKGKTALVTGGNRGIGKGIALALAQAGADVAIHARDESAGRKAVEEIKKAGVKCEFFKGDITVPEDVERVVDGVVGKFGKIDVLVNNAGIVRNVNAEDMTWSDWYDVINVNLNGVFLMSQAVGRVMIKNRSGSIINISSMSANIVNIPQPQSSYNASKAAVSHLTRSLAMEWAPYNVRVNAIAPGFIETELTHRGLSTDWGKVWVDMTPMKRVGQPEELGGVAVYLASEASSFTTGSIIVVDGGYSII